MHVTIKSDHRPLKGLFQNEIPATGRISKWLATMSQYDYTTEYVPGKTMGHADALFRRGYSQQLPEAQLHPIESPFYDMDDESMAKIDCFPALSVVTQIEKVGMKNQATQTQGEVGPRNGLALPISQLNHKKEDRVERRVDLDHPINNRVNQSSVGRNS